MKRIAVALVLVLTTGLLPAAAPAAEPARGTVRPPSGATKLGPELRWTGARYQTTANPVPGDPACNPDPCDVFHLEVGVTASYWKTHAGALRIRIDGYDANQDFDLRVYRERADGSRGEFVDSSASVGVLESVTIPSASGRYQIVAVPWAVIDSGYNGHAWLEVSLRRSGRPASPSIIDPARRGPLKVRRLDYDAGAALVSYQTGVYPEELRGSIHTPLGGRGRFPLILLLHGRHDTCRAAQMDQYLSPCPTTPATDRIDSYRGYDYLAELLASHGYLVVSVNANGTNAYDQYTTQDFGAEGRAQVLARTLDLLSEWNRVPGPSPVDGNLVGRIDMDRIGLMGHSRGGEGVTKFVAYNRERTDGPRYKLRAVLALAATDFADHKPTGVAFAALLPTCDGDVSDLQGAHAFERGKEDTFPRIQWVVRGANHNWFNTTWTSDDAGSGTSRSCDGSEPGTLRLAPEDQRRVGLVLMSAFLRRYVGGETAFEPIVTGASPLPESACPRGWGPCSDLVRTSSVAPSTARRSLLALDAGNDPLHRAAHGGAIRGSGLLTYTLCNPTPDSADGPCPDGANRSWTRQMYVGWNRPSRLRIELKGDGANARKLQWLTIRVAVPEGRAQDFDVVLTDAKGRSVVLQASRFGTALRPLSEWGGNFPLVGPPVEDPPETHVILNQIRIPVGRFTNVSLSSLRSLELRFGERTKQGAIYLGDIAFQETVPPRS